MQKKTIHPLGNTPVVKDKTDEKGKPGQFRISETVLRIRERPVAPLKGCPENHIG